MVPTPRSILAVLTALLVVGCTGSPAPEPPGVERDGDRVRGTGTVQWYDLEGGFYAIRGDDDVTYDPIDLPEAFQEDGLGVWFEGTLREDMAGIHMVGPIIELEEIRRRDDGT